MLYADKNVNTCCVLHDTWTPQIIQRVIMLMLASG